jgi:tocopherol O-methyltransferase
MARNLEANTVPDRLSAYYDQTWSDYVRIWVHPRVRAMHFGYWDETTATLSQAQINMNRKLAATADLQIGDNVLDAGCGIGGSSVWLALAYEASVLGITLVSSQVAKAREYARQREVDHLVTFARRDFTSTGLPAGSFDVLWAQESLCHASNKEHFLPEAYRLLRTGGRLVVGDFFRTGPVYSRPQERLLRRWLDGWVIPDLLTGDEIRAWASKAGFRDIQLEDITPRIMRTSYYLFLLSSALSPLTDALHLAGLRSTVQQKNVESSRRQWLCLNCDLWFYGVFLAVK